MNIFAMNNGTDLGNSTGSGTGKTSSFRSVLAKHIGAAQTEICTAGSDYQNPKLEMFCRANADDVLNYMMSSGLGDGKQTTAKIIGTSINEPVAQGNATFADRKDAQSAASQQNFLATNAIPIAVIIIGSLIFLTY